MTKSLMIILIAILCLSHCSKNIDPTTTILKYIIKNGKKQTSPWFNRRNKNVRAGIKTNKTW